MQNISARERYDFIRCVWSDHIWHKCIVIVEDHDGYYCFDKDQARMKKITGYNGCFPLHKKAEVLKNLLKAKFMIVWGPLEASPKEQGKERVG